VENAAPETGESAILICGLVESDDSIVVEGAITITCSVCEAAIYVAPSGQKLLADDPTTVPMCGTCGDLAILNARESGDEVTMHTLPETPEELLTYFKNKLEERRQKLTEMYGEADFNLKPNPDGSFNVKIHPEAIKEFRQLFPDMPPMDELFMKIHIGECAVCGEDASKMGAMEPEYIDLATGEVHGHVICEECLLKGE